MRPTLIICSNTSGNDEFSMVTSVLCGQLPCGCRLHISTTGPMSEASYFFLKFKLVGIFRVLDKILKANSKIKTYFTQSGSH